MGLPSECAGWRKSKVNKNSQLCRGFVSLTDGVEFQFNVLGAGTVVAPILARMARGRKFVIPLSGPLSTDHPAAHASLI
jgi:hypothetical protein